jgi:signal transduction histidine kinase
MPTEPLIRAVIADDSARMNAAGSRGAGLQALAVTMGVFAVLTSVATVALAIANAPTFHGLLNAELPAFDVPITFGVLGALVATRQRQNPVGWLFLFIAVVGGIQGVADGYTHYAFATHLAAPAGIWALWVDSWVTISIFPAGALALLLLLFPDGHLPSRRWKPLAATCVAVTAVLVPVAIFYPGPLSTSTNFATPNNPIGLPITGGLEVAVQAVGLLWLPGIALFLAAACAPLVRMRRAAGEERQQLKWIAYAVAVTAVAYIPLTFLPDSTATGLVDIAIGFGILVPIAAGIAIFKYRLYDIDIVISRTLVYGSLAAFITVVYVGIAVGIGTLVGSGGKPNLALSILATAIVAIGFQPVREQVQKVANRLVYGRRATPYEVLSEFSGRVADTYAADEVLPRMARVLQEGTGAESATVWLRGGDELRAAATFPGAANGPAVVPMRAGTLPVLLGTTRSVEVRHQGELLGALSVNKRRGEALTPIEQKLVDDLAHQAGLVLKNVGLTAALQARLEDLRASRQRLVSAQDEERRRLERNLHDGAQQHLVALKVKLGLAEMLLARDPAKATATLEQLKGDADDALETLRDLARGIYPPLLAEKGLVTALESQARKATLPVLVDAAGIGRYRQDLEAAVYFCVLEALQNVQKYAKATHATIRLREADGQLRIEVEDDGIGFEVATVQRGAGLTNMEDRLDALEGTLLVQSSTGHGTCISMSLPLPVPVAVPD